jgi:hypothetical protein
MSDKRELELSKEIEINLKIRLNYTYENGYIIFEGQDYPFIIGKEKNFLDAEKYIRTIIDESLKDTDYCLFI